MTLPRPAAVIFDFDGVVVDSELYWDAGTVDVYREMVPTWTEEDDRTLKGRNVHDIYEMLVRDHGATFDKQRYLDHIDAFATSIYAEKTQPMDGLLDLVDRIAAARIPIAIASSSERRWIDLALARLRIEEVFPVIVTARDVGRGKPDPAVYLEAARRLGVDPAACAAIEDSTNGILSAKAAGMTCIGLLHMGGAYAQDLSQADIIVDGLREIGI